MAKQIPWLYATVSLAWLTLPLVCPPALRAEGTVAPSGQPRFDAIAVTAAPPLPSPSSPATAATHAKKSRKHLRQNKRKTNRFVRLGRRILDDTFICQDEFEFTGTTLDPKLNGCLAVDNRFKWAFAGGEPPPIGLTEHPFVDPEDAFGAPQLLIQPLHVHLGKYNPLFKQFFTPLSQAIYMSVGDIPLAADTWLLEQDWLDDRRSGTAFERLFSTDPGLESAPISYRYDMDRSTAVIAGVGWIYDIADTTGMAQAFAQAGYDTSETLGAVNLILGYSINAITLTGGYIHAVESREGLANYSQNGQENDPTAWSSQLAYSTRFLNRPAVFAVGYQKSSETLSHYLPEERYSTRASFFLQNSTTLSLEYYQDRMFTTGDGILDEDAYGITTRLGFHF
nr:hypothetical protein [uncultured Desulfobulbus sp.]